MLLQGRHGLLQERFRSERLACRVVGQHRSTQRHGGKVVSIEEAKLLSSNIRFWSRIAS